MAYMCKQRNKECDGCGDCVKDITRKCPHCGETLTLSDKVFASNGVIVACEYCCSEEVLAELIE